MEYDQIRKLAGGWQYMKAHGETPFSDLAIEFLQDLSKKIMIHPLTKNHEDMVAFAFWCRKNQLMKWRESFAAEKRLGYGMLLHIAPSNIPALFAYSMVLGMLSGNGNLIRISNRVIEQAYPLCQVIDETMKEEKYRSIYERNLIVSYERNDKITTYFSNFCDGRILWGGDHVIRHIHRIAEIGGKPELIFPDRFSIAVIDGEWIKNLSNDLLQNLIHRFYNDTYLMDQNACTSPHIIFWTPNTDKDIINKWWKLVLERARKYDLTNWKAMRKYENLCRYAMNDISNSEVDVYNNFLYVITLKEISSEIQFYNDKYGFFYQYTLKSLEELADHLNRKVQTILYAGVNPARISEIICNNGAKGGDRIVPIGQGLQLSYIWDGKNMLHQLSRIIDVQL